MPKHDPYKTDRKAHDKERVDKFLGRKSGGRVKDDEGTNIHIEINAAPPQGATDEMPPPTAGPIPPPPPMPPMMPPGPEGGPMGGGGPLGLKTGGAVKKQVGGAMMGRRVNPNAQIDPGAARRMATRAIKPGGRDLTLGGGAGAMPPQVPRRYNPNIPLSGGMPAAGPRTAMPAVAGNPRVPPAVNPRVPPAGTDPRMATMMRKEGGGVKQAKASSMDAGAGSGEGRLEKIGKRP